MFTEGEGLVYKDLTVEFWACQREGLNLCCIFFLFEECSDIIKIEGGLCARIGTCPSQSSHIRNVINKAICQLPLVVQCWEVMEV